MLPKDLLNLVFWELDHGNDLMNFSEISRRCHQIFHQNIKVIRKNDFEDAPKIYTRQKQIKVRHGLYHWWHSYDQLYIARNYCHGKRHRLSRKWYFAGEIFSNCNYHYGKKIEK